MFGNTQALLLDMNGTFMFGHDRFGEAEDFSHHYHAIGGRLPALEINSIIRDTYAYLSHRYPDPSFHNSFPSVDFAIQQVAQSLAIDERSKILDTFAFHELGEIPPVYAHAIRALSKHFRLGAIIDIWAPSAAWRSAFENAGVAQYFSAISFSSDCGAVKPSAKPFEWVLQELGVSPAETVMVGDCPIRDLGGARAAGIECVLVGGATHPDAILCCESLLSLATLLVGADANAPAPS